MPDEMRQAIGELANFVAPVEDGFILVTGKDFNREERNRLVAAGFIIWEVSGGKVIKGVKIAGKIGAAAVEGIVKTFGKKAVRETVEKTVKIAGKKIDNILDQKAIKATQEAIAKGEIDEELFEEFAEEIADIATKKERNSRGRK